jgi:elongation factor G
VILFWLGIETFSDEERLGRALQQLVADDSSLAVRSGADGTVMLGAPDEDRLQAAVLQLVQRFGVKAAVRRPEVANKLTVTRAAEGEWQYAVQPGRRGQYTNVKVRVEKGEPGSGCVVKCEKAIVGDAIPERVIRSVEEGIAEIDRGVVAMDGVRVSVVRVSMYDGSYDDMESSEGEFKIAARLAFIEALRCAKPILIEPIMTVSVVTPPHHESRVRDALRARGAGVQSFGEEDAENPMLIISALVPLSHMFGFGAELNARTWGAGTFTMTFSHYAPAVLSEDDGDRAADVTAPLRPRTPPLILRAAVPEPRD